MIPIREVSEILRKRYGLQHFNLKKFSKKGYHQRLILTLPKREKFVVKIFNFHRFHQIKKEIKILHYLSHALPEAPIYLRDLRGNAWASLKNKKGFLVVYKYVSGQVIRRGSNLPNQSFKKSAVMLAEIHNLPIPKKLGVPQSVVKETINNKKKYAKVLRTINRRRTGVFEMLISKVLTKRLESSESVIAAMQKMNLRNSFCFIHGDYAPSNIVISRDKISIIDWERCGVYLWQYDLFRALLNFSSSSRFTPYDSKKGINLMIRFLKYYFNHRKKIARSEIETLKLMPKLFYLLDTFPYDAVFLDGREELRRFLPKTAAPYAWWEHNENIFKKEIECAYAKLKKNI